jgi:hypothetical protein
MEQPFQNLKGVEGLLIFLNHPMREPHFEKGSLCQLEYDRLIKESFAEVRVTKGVQK